MITFKDITWTERLQNPPIKVALWPVVQNPAHYLDNSFVMWNLILWLSDVSLKLYNLKILTNLDQNGIYIQYVYQNMYVEKDKMYWMCATDDC